MSRVKKLKKVSRMDELNSMVVVMEKLNTAVYEIGRELKPGEYTKKIWDGENRVMIAALCNLESALALVLEADSDEITDLPKAHKQLFEIISKLKNVTNQFHKIRLMNS